MGEAFTSLALFGLFVPVLLLGLIVLAIVGIAARGSDGDPGGERPRAMYLTAVSFVTLFLTLFAAFAIVSAVVDLAIGDDGGIAVDRVEVPFDDSDGDGFTGEAPDPIAPSGFGSSGDGDNERYRAIVLSGLVALASGALYAYHRQKLAAYARGLPGARGAGRRAWDAYLHTVAFVAIFIALVSTVAAGYAIFQTIAPGVAGVAEREDGVRSLIPAAVLAAASFALFLLHWREANRPESPPERIVIEPEPVPVAPAPAPPRTPSAPDVEFAPPERAPAEVARERPIRRRERPRRPPRPGE